MIYLYPIHSTAPGQVGNIRIINLQLNLISTSQIYTLVVLISWNEPIKPNGVITSYEVTVAQTDNSNILANDSVTLPVVMLTLMPQPFTNYTVTVTASTSAGRGEDTTITYESPEAGKGTDIRVYYSVHDETFCQLYSSFFIGSTMQIL